ncbi:MAG: RNA polymerase factor sigma-54 [Ignavibacteriales bacterium]|nr:RNA polymerase factor sigma-54 [Ignavibacteriales bacterium]
MLHLSQQMRLLQKLTPQQIQYLKLLQLPTLALEQNIKMELEANPLLEEGVEDEIEAEQSDDDTPASTEEEKAAEEKKDDDFTFEDYLNDEETYTPKREQRNTDDEDKDDYPIAAPTPLTEKLLDQLHLADVTDMGMLVAEEIIGNIDEDGYLHRDLASIVSDINLTHKLHLTMAQVEEVLKIIQRLDPPGIGSRSLQECLLIQLEFSKADPHLVELARKLLTGHFDEFTKKHYEQISKLLLIPLDEVKKILAMISHLNPKPGEGTITAQENYLIPDFIVTKDENNFVIQLNDKNVPPLRINRNYRELMSKRNKATTTETKQFLKQKFDSAKWFIASIYQRRETMLKVMHAIVDRQRDFFETGEGLKPLIYKDIAETIRMDISTISRVVNGKYVQTDFGVFELRHFFSEGISTQSGEDVSNKEVKERIKEILLSEDKSKPLSDEEIASILKEKGFNIARRTVAKYRESMMIPVARLRRSI